MNLGQHAQVLKKSSLVFAGILAGVLLTITIGQYQGVVEVHLEKDSSYFKVDGYPRCEVVVR